MREVDSPYITTPVESADADSGFACGKHALDDYFARHALANHRSGISRAYVLRRAESVPADLPSVLGYYTLSMACVESTLVMHGQLVSQKLPRYPMPAALIGRLAIDQRAHGRRFGEALLLDALRRVIDASSIVGCLGIIVDAKDEEAERFYTRYDFRTVSADTWPHRMFLALSTARAAFASELM